MSESESNLVGGFFGVLLRLAVVLALGIAIAAGAYFGIPRVYRNLVEPAQVNTNRIDAIETELDLARADTSSLREQSGARLARIGSGPDGAGRAIGDGAGSARGSAG